MRALLLYNPTATTTRPRVRDAIAESLAACTDLDVAPTKQRDHASYLAAGAAHEGVDVVVALGGDGTVNEAIQGLARTSTALAVIPGGSTNVFARAIGLPRDALEATERLTAWLAEGRRRRVGLGTANGRYFCFNAGYGFDAATVREVERRHRLKRTVRQASFLWSGLMAFARSYDRRGTAIAVRSGAGVVEGCKTVVCCNLRPYSYLGRWPADLCPGADLDAGLDAIGLDVLTLGRLLRVVRAALAGDVAAVPGTHLWHDEERLVLSSAAPLPLQLDGDDVGDATRVELRSVPDALDLVVG